jgi:hypothetical protein
VTLQENFPEFVHQPATMISLSARIILLELLLEVPGSPWQNQSECLAGRKLLMKIKRRNPFITRPTNAGVRIPLAPDNRQGWTANYGMTAGNQSERSNVDFSTEPI